MKKCFSRILLISIIGLLLTGPAGCQTQEAADSSGSSTSTVTDMSGREIVVPSEINRIVGTSPHEMMITYMLAPEKLVGLTSAISGNLVPAGYTDIPVIGGWFSTNIGNYETFITLEPDIVLKGQVVAESGNDDIDTMQAKFGDIPLVVTMLGGNLTDIETPIEFVGDLIGESENADALVAYYQEAMDYVNNIAADVPESEKVRIYYAEGKDGLSTDPTGSRHTELIDLCGGTNIADVTLKPGAGQAQVSMEQILGWNPDAIIIGRGSQAALYKQITTDPTWADLEAVKNNRVYVRPSDPFSWFDGPPGANQIIGLYWTVKTLYPEKTTDLDLSAKVKEFYSRFYHYDLTDEEVTALLANPS